MVSKCANPTCSALFLYLHEGKLFRIEVESPGKPRLSIEKSIVVDKKPVRRVEFFWLCNLCCQSMTLAVVDGKAVAAPLAQARRAAS